MDAFGDDEADRANSDSMNSGATNTMYSTRSDQA
jgi:hypothetical protein